MNANKDADSLFKLRSWARGFDANRYKSLVNTGTVILLMVLVASCEDPGVVGTTFVDTGAAVVSDTLKVDNYKLESGFPVFTGNKPFISVGKYEDELFGDLTASGLMKPVVTQSIDTLHPDASFGVELGIAKHNVYGDTTTSTAVELVEISEPWRGVSWKINKEIPLTNNILATRDIEMQDSLIIKLPDSFFQKYRDFYYKNSDTRDSLYRYNFNGFAIRPTGGDKIIAIDAGNSSFVYKNPQDTAWQEIRLGSWGYSLDRTNVPALPDSLNRIYSTQEQVVNFIFDSDRQSLGSENVSRAEMVLNQGHERMQNSLPKNHVRPVPDVLNLYLQDPDQLDFSLATYQPSFRVQLDSVDHTFRVDLTRYVNQQLFVESQSDHFIGTLRSNDGVIRSTIISNPKAPLSFPRLLLTTVNSDIESN